MGTPASPSLNTRIGLPGRASGRVLRLARDLADPERFVSFGRWDSAENAHAWKSSPEFRERMGRVQAHVAEFTPDELEIIALRGSD
jgi:heme-degrading monooxygenase HmoA